VKSKSDDGTKDEAEPGDKIDWEELVEEDKTSPSELDVRKFSSRFEKMLEDSDITGLIVLIDDLDRCNPDNIIDNLEAIKLFLKVEHAAFVIGAGRRIVEHAIRKKYAQRAADQGDREQTERLVKDYLEKLVQVPYNLPRLSRTEIETYMTLLFCQRHLEQGEFNACLAACNESRSKNRGTQD
jgi:predicted KAP-like P-loop ATPase